MSAVEPVTIPADAPPVVAIPVFRLASARISAELTTIELAAAELTSALDQERRKGEEALQEAGRLRARVEELEAVADDGIAYLLWSGRHSAWWAPDERGYTDDIERAGRYSRTDATRLAAKSALCGVLDQVTCMVAAPENWPTA